MFGKGSHTKVATAAGRNEQLARSALGKEVYLVVKVSFC